MAFWKRSASRESMTSSRSCTFWSTPAIRFRRWRDAKNEGGSVVVVVPNYLSLDSRLKDMLSKLKLKNRAYKHLALGHHNWVFSIKSLEVLGEKCGLRVAHRQTRQPVWRTSWWRRFLERRELAGWCWVVYRNESG